MSNDSRLRLTPIQWLICTIAAIGFAFDIYEIAGGYQIMTRPEFAPMLDRFHTVPVSPRLSTPALETLAIVASAQHSNEDNFALLLMVMRAIAGGFIIAYSEVAVTYAFRKVVGYLSPVEPDGLLQLLSTDYKFAVSFMILVAVLLIRPTGIIRGKVI